MEDDEPLFPFSLSLFLLFSTDLISRRSKALKHSSLTMMSSHDNVPLDRALALASTTCRPAAMSCVREQLFPSLKSAIRGSKGADADAEGALAAL